MIYVIYLIIYIVFIFKYNSKNNGLLILSDENIKYTLIILAKYKFSILIDNDYLLYVLIDILILNY